MQIEQNKSQLLPVSSRILIFGLMLFVLDFLVGSGLSWMYKNQKKGLFYRTTYGLEKTTADLLIFGSSSANHHYIPEVISKRLNLSVYNQGRDGTSILYHWAIFKGVIKRYKPKIVLLNLAPNELSTEEDFDRLSVLSPYYKEHGEIRDIVKLKSKFEPLKQFSMIYPYNSTVLTMLPNIVCKNKRLDDGYYPLFNSMKKQENLQEPFINEPNLSATLVDTLNKFIFECTQNKIDLFIIFSPWVSSNTSMTGSVKETNELSRKKKVISYNFINHPEFSGQFDIFQDPGHLNHKGAMKFSNLVAEKISIDLGKRN